MNIAFAAVCQPVILYYFIHREKAGGVALDKYWVANISINDREKFNDTINLHFNNLYLSLVIVALLITSAVYKDGFFLVKKFVTSIPNIN